MRLFVSRSKYLSFDREPSTMGILPVRLFSYMVKLSSAEQLPTVTGISPWSKFFDKERYLRQNKWPISFGIVPCRLLDVRLVVLRKVRLPMEGDMDPANPSMVRFKVETLCRCR